MFLEILPLSLVEFLLCILIIFIAYTIKGLSGFGSGLVAIPLLVLFLPITIVVPVLGLLSYTGTVYQSYSYRHAVSWSNLLPLLPFSLLGIVLALWLLVNVERYILTFWLGVFIFCYSVYSLFMLSIKPGSRYWAILAGSFAGLVGALFGTGGPFYVIYLKMRQLGKAQFRATIVMIFFFDGGARMAGYFLSGLFTVKMLMLVLLLLPVLGLAMYVGNHLHIKINELRFNQLVSILLLVSGLSLMVKSIFQLV